MKRATPGHRPGDRVGYAVRPWGQGPNFGLRPGVLDRARDGLLRLADEHGRKVSLGGIFARAREAGAGLAPR